MTAAVETLGLDELRREVEELRARVGEIEKHLSAPVPRSWSKGGRGGDPVLDAFAERCRQQPGEWLPFPKAISKASARTYTNTIPAGKLRAFEPRQYEAKRGGSGLLVRFVGGVQ